MIRVPGMFVHRNYQRHSEPNKQPINYHGPAQPSEMRAVRARVKMEIQPSTPHTISTTRASLGLQAMYMHVAIQMNVGAKAGVIEM